MFQLHRSGRHPTLPTLTRRLLIPLAVSALVATSAPRDSAQDERTVVQVTDVRGKATLFALGQVVNGVSRVAEDFGRAVFNMKSADSLNIQARRIGFQPYIGG